jgi:hypothetical protein
MRLEIRMDSLRVVTQARREGGCDGLVGSRVRMEVAWETPRRVESHQQIGQVGVVENAGAHGLLHELFWAELGYDDQWNGAALARDIGGGAQDFLGNGHAAVDGSSAAVGDQPAGEFDNAPQAMRREPDQARAEVRAVCIEIAIEQRGGEERDDCYWLTKAREFGSQAQVGLVRGVAVHGQVNCLDAEEGFNLRGNSFFPADALAYDHGFAGEDDGGAREVDGVIGAADSIASGVESVIDGASGDGVMAGTGGDESPAEQRVAMAARFFSVGAFFGGASKERVAENQFAGAEGEGDGERYAGDIGERHAGWDASGKQGQSHAEERHYDAHGGFGDYIRPVRGEERRQEMAVEPSLIGKVRAHQKRDTKQRDSKANHSIQR